MGQEQGKAKAKGKPRGEALRAEILRVARRLFVDRGYQETSMRMVAREAGCSATAIYLYFANKDDLMFAVVDEGFEQFTQKLHEAGTFGGSPTSRLRRLGWAYVEFGLEHPEHYSLMFLQRTDFLMRASSGEEEGDETPRHNALGVLQKVIAQTLRAEPENSMVTAHADAFWSGIHGIVALSIATPLMDRARAMHASEAFIELFISGLADLR